MDPGAVLNGNPYSLYCRDLPTTNLENPNMLIRTISAFAALTVAMTFAAGAASAQGGPPRFAPLLMETDAFEDGGVVPLKYAGRGENVQPGFRLSNVPEGTVSYAIIFHDIDVALQGGTNDVLHWIVWNIPVAAGGIPEGGLPAGAVQGRNIAGQNAYFGPGAPPGPRYHHYVFELYALNAMLDLPETAGRTELLAAMEGKTVGKSAYVGRFRGSE
jgi:Raf kinase inhibitor-like YbhB/YbcL family protein